MNLSNNVSLIDKGTEVSEFATLSINGKPVDNYTAKNFEAKLKSAKMIDVPETSKTCVVAAGTAKFAITLILKGDVRLPMLIELKCEDNAASCD